MNEGRRKLTKILGAVSVGVWTKPVIDSVTIPTHAQASPSPPPPPCPERNEETGGSECPEVER